MKRKGMKPEMIQNVVFMGTPDFAVGTLRALIQSDYQVKAVFCQPDKPKGRGKSLAMPPVKEEALRAGIPVYQPGKIREEEWLLKIEEMKPDAIVVVAFGQILPERVLKAAKYGCINVHASLLPKYRGAAPIQWAVINGEKVSGVTTMRMDAGLDTGDMILWEEVPLEEEETGGSLFDKLSGVGAKLLIRTLDEISAGKAVYHPQPKESPTAYAAMLTKKQGEISWEQPAKKIECLIRGLNPWPSAYTHYRGKMLKIWRANTLQGQPDQKAEPGQAVQVTKHSLEIQTGDGILSVKELQPEGKKRMGVDEFLRGYPVETGERFGRVKE